MSYQPDFSDCWSKVARAMEHRNTLKAEIESFVRQERHVIRVSAQYEPDTRHHVFRAGELPDDFLPQVGLMVGDIAHNLRCVLDYIVWQLACFRTGGATLPGVPEDEARKVAFPLDDRPPKHGDPRRLREHGALKHVDPAHRAIIAAHQPYVGWGFGKHPLAVLQNLSNTDKHRVVNPVLIATRGGFSFKDSPLEGMEETRLHFVTPWQPLESGAEIMRGRLPDNVNFDMDMAGYAPTSIQLPQGTRSKGGVVQDLDGVAGYVVHVLREFEPLF